MVFATYVSYRANAGLSVRSKKNCLISVRTFFNWANAKTYRSAGNHATKISTPKIDWEAPSILTPAEAQQLPEAAKREQEGRLLASVILNLFAGIRSNEIMRLDWSVIDLKEGILSISSQIAKERRLRVMELMPNRVPRLKTIKNREGWVAAGKNTVRWAEFVKRLVSRIGVKTAGMRCVTASAPTITHSTLKPQNVGDAGSPGERSGAIRQLPFSARKNDAKTYFEIRPERLS